MFLPDCHNAVTVYQQRTAPTQFQPCVPKGLVPNQNKLRVRTTGMYAALTKPRPYVSS